MDERARSLPETLLEPDPPPPPREYARSSLNAASTATPTPLSMNVNRGIASLYAGDSAAAQGFRDAVHDLPSDR
jgi:hypothetical protein